MRRLQVGDECYVRIIGSGLDNKIWKIKYDHVSANTLKTNRSFVRIVYPYPIIKQLAK